MDPTDQALRTLLIRNFNTTERQHEEREPLYDTSCARLARGTAASKLGITVDIVAPGKVSCPYHFHFAQEEAFVILEGQGSLRVAGAMLAIGEGDTIFIPPGPDYPHQIINTSDRPLKYLSISTRETPEVVVYPDSGKFMTQVADTVAGRPYLLLKTRHLQGDVDYWQGEP